MRWMLAGTAGAKDDKRRAHNSMTLSAATAVNIIILDDYQDAVRKLKCADKMEALHAKVFTNNVKGIGQLSVRLRDAEVLVLIRERTHFPRQLLEKLPRLRLIAQTGQVGPHIDIDACTRLGIAVAEGAGSPIAPAELTWALIMAAMRRIPQFLAEVATTGWYWPSCAGR